MAFAVGRFTFRSPFWSLMADWQKPNQSFSLVGTGNGAVLGLAVGMSSDCSWLDMFIGSARCFGGQRKWTYVRSDCCRRIVARVRARELFFG